MKKIFIYIILLFQILFIGNFGGVYAEIGDIGHWRDSVGSQIPGTTFGGFNFNSEIRNDGIYTKPNNSTVEVTEAGDYLVIATTHDDSNTNDRYNSQLTVQQIAGTGDIFSSYYTGYSRNTTEDESWTRAITIVVGASANSQFQVQKRRDADDLTGGSVVNNSDLQVIRLTQTNYGIYGIGGDGVSYGGTTPNTVSVDSIISESDSSAIEGNTTTNNITLKGDNRKYLVAWSTSFDDGSATRTQRIGHLEYDGTDKLSTRAYCYGRDVDNEYCGLGSLDIVETATADIVVQTEIYSGDGVLADQGGADSDGSNITDGNGQMIILEMPEYLEAFSSEDSVGLQDVTTAQTLNIARDVNISDSLSFSKSTDTLVNVKNSSDIFSWANIWTARSNVASGVRQTSYGSVTIDGIEQSVGQHGNYSRGNQSITDTFAMGFQPAGIYTTSGPGSILGINTDPIVSGGAGGTDRTQPGTLGFFALNLDTLVAPFTDQVAYRFFENTDSSDVGAVLATQNSPATLSADGQAFRLRSLISVTQNKLRQNETDFKLQFAQQVGVCDVGFTGEIYNDVTASSAIAFNNNLTPTDEDSLTANANDPINGATPVINQTYQELNNFSTSISAIAEDQDGKWDFSLIDNTAPDDTSYCFRMVESDGTLLDGYSTIPEITTSGAILNNTPTDITLSNNTIDENVAANTTIGTFSTVDPDTGDTHTYSLISGTGDTDNGAFTISGNTLSINASPDFETQSSYSIRVQTDDGNGGTFEKIFTITINNLDEVAPVISSTSFASGALLPGGNHTISITYSDADSGISTGTGNTDLSNNIAPNANITHTTATVWGVPPHPQSIVNGIKDTTGAFDYEFHSDTGNAFIEFEWDTPQKIGDMKIYNRTACCDFRLTNATIKLYDESNTLLHTHTLSDTTGVSIVDIDFEALGEIHNVKKLRLDTVDNNTINIREIEIFPIEENIKLFKWDGTDWGDDIAHEYIDFSNSTFGTSSATYPISNLEFGKYQYVFTVDDNAGNTTSEIVDFYIDEPEFIISTPEIDMGNLSVGNNIFSPTVTVTVKTIGAAFDVTMDRTTALAYGIDEIQSYDGIIGYGYEQAPYTSAIFEIAANQSLASESASINTNGDKNTYTYEIQLGAIVDAQQAAGDYVGDLKFDIDLQY